MLGIKQDFTPVFNLPLMLFHVNSFALLAMSEFALACIWGHALSSGLLFATSK
jgi:hypothetical protein